jgi:phosphoribosylanthranilate isomerase
VPELPRIKVCGITLVEDALAAVEAGCDALGVVEYARSPRRVDAARAREIVEAVGKRAIVIAVMVDASPELALRWLEASGAHGVQLCGGELASAWRGFAHPVLRRIPVDERAERELETWRDVASAFVLDHPSGPGGTGQGVELPRAARLCALAPCLLAGGLDDRNVAERVAAAAPFGVAASSRLESAAGRKDRARVAAFVRNARAALEATAR